jgi:hypothetical protein
MKEMLDQSPEQVAQEDVKRAAITLVRRVVDHGRRYLSLSLLKLVVVGVAGVVFGVISLPLLTVVGCALVVALALGYAVYSHRLLHDAREELRWAFVGGKRVQRDNLEVEQRVDEAVLAIMGKSEDRTVRVRARPPELAQALRVVNHRLADAQAAQNPQPRTAAVRRGAAPQEPDLKVVRARIAERQTEREALEAEIQSLASPGDIDAAMAAEDARKHAKSASHSARQATQAARERRRLGQRATQPDAGGTIALTMRANGTREVSQRRPKPTPEQIAQGLIESPALAGGEQKP